MSTELTVRVVGEIVCQGTHLKGYNTYVQQPPASAAAPGAAAPGAATVTPVASPTGAAPVEKDNTIVASTCGVVEAVDRVVSIRGVNPRYHAEVGDVVVARVKDVLSNKWLCDVRSPQLAHMLLSNVTEPGGMLRRRGREDELTMRRIFCEGDLVAAEVQRVTADGMVSLHTRSAAKYGKVQSQGVLVPVSPALVRRVRKHYHVFSFGVSAVFGINGNVWVYRTTPQTLIDIGAVQSDSAGGVDLSKGATGAGVDPVLEETTADEDAKAAEGKLVKGIIEDNAEALHAIARARNCLLALNSAGHSIEPATLRAAWIATHQQRVPAADVLLPEHSALITNVAATARDAEAANARKRRRE